MPPNRGLENVDFSGKLNLQQLCVNITHFSYLIMSCCFSLNRVRVSSWTHGKCSKRWTHWPNKSTSSRQVFYSSHICVYVHIYWNWDNFFFFVKQLGQNWRWWIGQLKQSQSQSQSHSQSTSSRRFKLQETLSRWKKCRWWSQRNATVKAQSSFQQLGRCQCMFLNFPCMSTCPCVTAGVKCSDKCGCSLQTKKSCKNQN